MWLKTAGAIGQARKAGLAMMNLIGENYRLPLVPIQEKSRALLRVALLELGLLQPERAARPGTPV